MNYPKIINAEILNYPVLKLFFSDNSVKIYNFNELLKLEQFEKLKNEKYFRTFQIEQGGYGLVWDEDTDIAEYELWKNGIDTTSN